VLDSQDQVKPWFDGKLDFSPTVQDFIDQGFPLEGGRIDVVHGRSVAALVYARRKHFVKVFIWPTDEKDAAPRSGSQQGYQWIDWRKGGTEFCAVSDAAPSALEQLQRLFTEWLRMSAQMTTRMDLHARKCLKNWIITVESTDEQHQEIILSTIVKRAHQIFEERGCTHGFELDDWLTAEQELFCEEVDGNTSGFHLLVEFRTRHVGEANCGPDVQSVHLFSKELDRAQADVRAADGVFIHHHLVSDL
jgi:Protein of unknown function (DUF2934)